jgi:16S rRNA (guanine527-N7)-methyltransferase
MGFECSTGNIRGPLSFVPRGTEPISDRDLTTGENSRARVEDLIKSGLERLEVDDCVVTAERLSELVFLLFTWAPKMNLTGHRTPDMIATRLVLDAVAMASRIPSFTSLADLGSGAGFPGLPIAVAFPARRIVSVEARSRRVFFQRHVVRELGLQNVEVLEGRIEEIEPVEQDCVVAQALAPPVRVLDYMAPWCREGGILAIPGTSESLEFEVPPGPPVFGGEILRYSASPADPDRLVWVARKQTPGC